MYRKIYGDNEVTLYCGCNYTNKTPDLQACGYDGSGQSQAARATRTEAEHITPASWFGRTRACYRSNLCPTNAGFKSSRQCCEQIDRYFETALNDLHNLAPAVGQVNAIRSNHPYGLVANEDRDFGTCDFEFENNVAEPTDNIRGDIARIYFYMEATYGLTVSPQDRALLETWSAADPPDTRELERNELVKAIQGRGNSFVENEP